MKVALIAALGFAALQGCAHTKPSRKETVCSTEYNPHLCLVTIGGALYGGYGPNKCEARKRLASALEGSGLNAKGLQVQCGPVTR